MENITCHRIQFF